MDHIVKVCGKDVAMMIFRHVFWLNMKEVNLQYNKHLNRSFSALTEFNDFNDFRCVAFTPGVCFNYRNPDNVYCCWEICTYRFEKDRWREMPFRRILLPKNYW